MTIPAAVFCDWQPGLYTISGSFTGEYEGQKALYLVVGGSGGGRSPLEYSLREGVYEVDSVSQVESRGEGIYLVDGTGEIFVYESGASRLGEEIGFEDIYESFFISQEALTSEMFRDVGVDEQAFLESFRQSETYGRVVRTLAAMPEARADEDSDIPRLEVNSEKNMTTRIIS